MSLRLKKASAVSLVLLILLTFVPEVYAGSAGVFGYWASDVINNWSQKGLIASNDTKKVKPDELIKKAEFVSLVVKVFNYTDKSDAVFSDVHQSTPYADYISKAVAAGIVKGDGNGLFKPDRKVSRQEAAVILSRAFELKARDGIAASRFDDSDKIAAWSMEAISAMLEKGYVKGRLNNKFVPQDGITRAEAIKMIDNVMGELKNTGGTYSGEVKGNLVINTKGVNLRDTTIDGDLYITQGVGDGEVALDNVKVKGRTIIRGGGEHSIIINNSSLEGIVVVYKADGRIRIAAKGSTEISNIELNSGAKLQQEKGSGKGFGNVQIVKEILAG